MLNSIKSKIKDVEEKQKIKRAEKERKKQEKIDAWNKEQEELKLMLDSYYSKYQGFINFIEHTNFENLYEIYYKDKKYNEYFKLIEMLEELKKYDFSKHEGLNIQSNLNGDFDAFFDKVKNKYQNDELIQKFLKDPYRFKALIVSSDFLIKDIKKTVYTRVKYKLDEILWDNYDSYQVQKLKFFYDLFLRDSKATTVNFFVTLNPDSPSRELNGIDGTGEGKIESVNKQSIYEFVLSDIRYCKLLDQVN